MAGKAAERLKHAVLALLLSVGLAFPLCGSLDTTLISPGLFIWIFGTVLLFELASLHRVAAWTAAAGTAAGLTAWIFGGDGARLLSDAVLAIGLRIRGISVAVPLAAQEITVLITVTVSVLSCFSVLRKATCIPSLMLCTAAIMTVWLTDSMELLPWLLPGLAVVLALLLVYRFDDPSPLSVLPWAALLTVIAFLFAGAFPTNNSFREKADEIRQAVLDRLFFTEARDVFSLYSVGFSPQGADQLGGRPNPSDNRVMQVSTSKTVYLRGSVYNRYDGHGWQNTTGGRRYLWQSVRMQNLRSDLFNEKLPPASVQNSLSNPVSVSVRMLSGSASTLFVPQRIRELTPGGELVPYYSDSSEVFVTRNLQGGDTYEVSAPLYSPEDPGTGSLTEICASLDDTRWEDIRKVYLELPAHLEQPLMELTAKITEAAETPFEKARAIQNYLKRNFRYSLDVGEHPENIDFVTSFLLDTKKGYCTYFASAMTVLCRIAGLPARYVEGYLAVPNEYGEAIVTGLDAHAWTEIYFKGFGWLTFDATPAGRESARGENGNMHSPEPPSPEPSETPEPEENGNTVPPPENDPENPATEPPDGSGGEPPEVPPDAQNTPEDSSPDEENEKKGASPFPWWLFIVFAAAVAVAARILITSPAFRCRNAKSQEQIFEIWAEELFRLLRAEGFERRKGETLTAFARRTDAGGHFSESVYPAGACISTMRYSKRIPTESESELVRDTSLMIHGEMSRKGKLRYYVHRLVSFGRKRGHNLFNGSAAGK